MVRRRIAVFTGTRADYSLLRPLLQRLASDPRIELYIIAGGSHYSREFGLTYQEIEKDGFLITERIEMLLSSDNPVAISSAMGLCLISSGGVFERLKPDLIVLLGDRYECLCMALAATIASVRIAHIHGGERTEGSLDEMFRHAITKLAHFHFAAAEEYRLRIIQLGEDPSRVINAGALGIDNVRSLQLLSPDQIRSDLGLPKDGLIFLVTFHPATAEVGMAEVQFKSILGALKAFNDSIVVFTKSNADEGGRTINTLIDVEVANNPSRRFAFASLGSLRYLSLARASAVTLGNSSSAIIELPALGVPVIDIGDRQKGRLRSSSVVHCAAVEDSIRLALSFITGKEGCRFDAMATNPYGEGKASITIAEFLAATPLVAMAKPFYDCVLKEASC